MLTDATEISVSSSATFRATVDFPDPEPPATPTINDGIACSLEKDVRNSRREIEAQRPSRSCNPCIEVAVAALRGQRLVAHSHRPREPANFLRCDTWREPHSFCSRSEPSRQPPA